MGVSDPWHFALDELFQTSFPSNLLNNEKHKNRDRLWRLRPCDLNDLENEEACGTDGDPLLLTSNGTTA